MNDIEKAKRGERIKYIREKELRLNKSQLAKKLGISSQFLGLVESGKGNLMYNSLKALKDLSGHSSDYILYGLDDRVIFKTNKLLSRYSEVEILSAIDMLKNISLLIKND